MTDEIGDTWAYGIASDADKVAEYRALLRMRTATEWKVEEAAYRNFSRLLLKVKHTVHPSLLPLPPCPFHNPSLPTMPYLPLLSDLLSDNI